MTKAMSVDEKRERAYKETLARAEARRDAKHEEYQSKLDDFRRFMAELCQSQWKEGAGVTLFSFPDTQLEIAARYGIAHPSILTEMYEAARSLHRRCEEKGRCVSMLGDYRFRAERGTKLTDG